jgi:hypothetical protein
MYATVRRYEGVSDPSEVVRIVNEGFLPIIREIPGFVDLLLSRCRRRCADFDQHLLGRVR